MTNLYFGGRVIPRRLNFMFRRFGTLDLFHLHRWCMQVAPPIKIEQRVPKRRYLKFRRRGITRKEECDIQKTAKFLNQELQIY